MRYSKWFSFSHLGADLSTCDVYLTKIIRLFPYDIRFSLSPTTILNYNYSAKKRVPRSRFHVTLLLLLGFARLESPHTNVD